MLGALVVGELRADSRLSLDGFQSALALDSRDELARRWDQPYFVEHRLPVRFDQNRGLDDDRRLRAARAQFERRCGGFCRRRGPHVDAAW